MAKNKKQNTAAKKAARKPKPVTAASEEPIVNPDSDLATGESNLVADADQVIFTEQDREDKETCGVTEGELEKYFGMPTPEEQEAEAQAEAEAEHECPEPAIGEDGHYTDESPASAEIVEGKVTEVEVIEAKRDSNGRIEVAIFLNRATDPEGRSIGMMDGYQPAHRMERVYTLNAQYFEGDTDQAICDEAFRVLNVDHPADYRQRSLSVGDVVGFEGKLFACESGGWLPVRNSLLEPEPEPQPEPEISQAGETFEAFHLKLSHENMKGTAFYIEPKSFASLGSAQSYSTPVGGANAVINTRTGERWMHMATSEGPYEWQQVDPQVWMTALRIADHESTGPTGLAQAMQKQSQKQLPAPSATPATRKRVRGTSDSIPTPPKSRTSTPSAPRPRTTEAKTTTRSPRREVHEWIAARVAASMTQGTHEVVVVEGGTIETEIKFSAAEGEATFLFIVNALDTMARSKGRQEARDFKLGAAYRLLAETQGTDLSTPQTDGLAITAGKYKWTVRGASNAAAYRAGYQAPPVVEIDPDTCSAVSSATTRQARAAAPAKPGTPSSSPTPPVASAAF